VSKALIAQLLAQRESDCDLREKSADKPAMGVRVRRPPETEWGRFVGSGHAIGAMRDIAVEYVIGWYGFTEADLLGASIGSSDAVEFSRELWEVAAADRADWVGLVFDKLLNLVTEYHQQRKEAAKN
jgi:hypothetical protein